MSVPPPEDQLPEEVRAAFGMTTLPDEALAEIGRAVAHFAILEHKLVRIIQGLLGLQLTSEGERVARVLTSELPFRGLLSLSASLIRELHGDELADEYNTVLKAVAAAEEERNVISHSFWGIAITPDAKKPFLRTKYTAKQKKGLTFRRDELDMDDLRVPARRIAAATHDLLMFASQRLGIFTEY